MDPKYNDALVQATGDLDQSRLPPKTISTLKTAAKAVTDAITAALKEEDKLVTDVETLEGARAMLEGRRMKIIDRAAAVHKLTDAAKTAITAAGKGFNDYHSQHKPKDKPFDDLSTAVSNAPGALDDRHDALNSAQFKRLSKASDDFKNSHLPQADKAKLKALVDTIKTKITDATKKDPSLEGDETDLDNDSDKQWVAEKDIPDRINLLTSHLKLTEQKWFTLFNAADGLRKSTQQANNDAFSDGMKGKGWINFHSALSNLQKKFTIDAKLANFKRPNAPP